MHAGLRALTRDTHHVGDDGGELDVHLHQGLLPVLLHRAALRAQEGRALALERAQRAPVAKWFLPAQAQVPRVRHLSHVSC